MTEPTKSLFHRFRELQAYTGWSEDDEKRVRAAAPLLEPAFPGMIDDFYEEIQRHEKTRSVIKGGEAQIERLKKTLFGWLKDLISAEYDEDYVRRRWQVGWRHVEIGLDQVFTNVALSRLRAGLHCALEKGWQGELQDFAETARSLDKLLDLDLAIIEDAYNSENLLRVRQQSEASFRSLVEAARSVIVILRADHSICYFSPGAEHVTGYEAATVMDHVDSRKLFSKSFFDALEHVFADQQVPEFESDVVCQDGTKRSIIWNAVLLDDYDGQPAFLGIGQDISRLKESQQRALQAERLAAIGQMVTGLAHESGNALARSQACLEMLSFEVEDNAEAMDLIKRIQAAQEHLGQLYNDVRGYAAPVVLERDEWDVSAIWRQAWTNLDHRRNQREIEFREELDRVDLTCFVDSFRLEQVFRNLFENSLVACADPVRIEVVCNETALSDRSALEIAVRDNGPGLDENQKKRIFEPFFTTKTKGTGLGMAIAKRIVDAHGGVIEVHSVNRRGTTVRITLPRD